MPIRIDRADALRAYGPAQRDYMFPEWAGDDDRQLGIAPTAGQCHPSVEVHYDTDFAVVATDGKEIKQLVEVAAGMFGSVGSTPVTLINGIKAGTDAVTQVLDKARQTKELEFSLNPTPCVEQPQRFKVTLEVVGEWIVSDTDAASDPEEVARVSLLLRAAGVSATAGFEHAKHTQSSVSFPIPRKDGSALHFKVEVETPPVIKPFKVYAKIFEEVQTNGPGNSAFNVVDLLQDAFTTSVSAIRISSIFIVIADLPND